MTPEQAREIMAQAQCLYDRAAVEAALDRMAEDITSKLAELDPLVLSVVNGGIVVTGCLLPRLAFPLQLDHVHATRYRGTRNGAELQWRKYPDSKLAGRVLLLVDDILDEGDTLAGIREWCLQQQATAVYTAVLVDKQHERRCAALRQADFTGMYTPDCYLFGFGMDCEEYWRNAPGIFALAD